MQAVFTCFFSPTWLIYFSDFVSTPCLRLAVLLLLQGSWDTLSMVAVVCSSWSVVNRHSSQRNELVPEGQTRSASVMNGNKMVSRVSLLLLLIGCLGSSYILENPERSIILEYPRLRWTFRALKCLGVSALCFNLSVFPIYVLFCCSAVCGLGF